MKFVFTVGAAVAFCVLTGAIVIDPDGSISFAPLIGFIESILARELAFD